MSGYRMERTLFYRPGSMAVTGAPAQGEWVNTEPVFVTESWGALRALPAEPAPSILGQGSRQLYRWRGPVFDRHRPEPGWEVEIAGRRYRVLVAVPVVGKVWRLDLERMD
jgi:hypothetical protein